MTLDNWEPPQVDEIASDLLCQTIHDQIYLGPYRLIIGFMSNSWTNALEGFGIKQPQGMMEQLLAMLWDELCEKVWNARNEILHSSQSMIILDEMKTLEDKPFGFKTINTQYLTIVIDSSQTFVQERSSDGQGLLTGPG